MVLREVDRRECTNTQMLAIRITICFNRHRHARTKVTKMIVIGIRERQLESSLLALITSPAPPWTATTVTQTQRWLNTTTCQPVRTSTCTTVVTTLTSSTNRTLTDRFFSSLKRSRNRPSHSTRCQFNHMIACLGMVEGKSSASTRWVSEHRHQGLRKRLGVAANV